MAAEAGGQLYESKVIAQLFGVSVRRIQQLTQDGVLEIVHISGQRNKYDLIPTIQAYIKYLSDKAYGREAKLSETELREKKLQAEIALKESQTELHQLRTAIANGKYTIPQQSAFILMGLLFIERSLKRNGKDHHPRRPGTGRLCRPEYSRRCSPGFSVYRRHPGTPG